MAKYFIKTKERENKEANNIFNKWYKYSLIYENFRRNLDKIITKAPINAKISAIIWCLYKGFINSKYENNGTDIITIVLFSIR